MNIHMFAMKGWIIYEEQKNNFYNGNDIINVKRMYF